MKSKIEKCEPQQCRDLIDNKKCEEIEFRYETLMGKYVINWDEDQTVTFQNKNISYLNVENYLKKL